MDPAFASAIGAAAQPKHRVLGLALQPLTVGHCFLFAEHKLNVPDRIEELDLADLVLATLICSQKTHAAARKLITSRFAKTGMHIWAKLVHRRMSLHAEALKFQDYLLDMLQRPADDDAEGGELKAPLCWRLAAMLMADFRLTWEQAMAMPVPIANCLWATEADRRGAITLLSERQHNFRAWVAEMEAKRLAESTK